MSDKAEGFVRAYTSSGYGNDSRRDRRVDRARRRRVTERVITEEGFAGEEPFERCPSCGERFCDGCPIHR